MSSPLFERCDHCPPAFPGKCIACGGTGFLAIGLTIKQVERLAVEAARLDFKPGDLAAVRGSEGVFIVDEVRGGLLFGHVAAGLSRHGVVEPARDCRRVGNIARKEGQPC